MVFDKIQKKTKNTYFYNEIYNNHDNKKNVTILLLVSF